MSVKGLQAIWLLNMTLSFFLLFRSYRNLSKADKLLKEVTEMAISITEGKKEMVNLLWAATSNAIEESKKAPLTTIYLYWDGVDEFGVVPEANKDKFLSLYPLATLLATFRNGVQQEND